MVYEPDLDFLEESLSRDFFCKPEIPPNSTCSQCHYFPVDCSGPDYGCLLEGS